MAESGVDLSYDESGFRPGSSPLAAAATGPGQASSSLPSNSWMIPAVFDGASLANFHQHGFIVPGSKSNLDLLPNLHGYAAPVNIHPHSSDVRMGQDRLHASSSCPLIPFYPYEQQIPPYRGGRKKEPPPDFLTEESQIQWTQERQKRNRHIQIEKRRRCKINDNIKELATLLPEHYDIDLQNKKGNILEASVDYIRKLRNDEKLMTQMKMQQEQLEQQNHRLRLKLQMLQMMSNSSQTTQQPLPVPPHQQTSMMPTPPGVNNLSELDPGDLLGDDLELFLLPGNLDAIPVYPDSLASLDSILSGFQDETPRAPPTTLGSATTGISLIPVMVDEFMEFST